MLVGWMANASNGAASMFNQTTLTYVERFVPDHSGPNYIAHITLGFAKLDDPKCRGPRHRSRRPRRCLRTPRRA
jgi:hypothetical protein